MESKPLAPKLRFPEFRDAPGWETKPLHSLAMVKQGGTPDTSNPEYWGGAIQWLTPAEMGKSNSPHISATDRTITETGLGNCSSELLPERSVIMSTRAPIGHLAINLTPMAINQGCRGLVPSVGVDTDFLYSSLLIAKPKLIDLGAGNTFKELSGSALKMFQIPKPADYAEQKKIAGCLTSLDELIAAEGRKLEALRTHKKGLMQNLFPREGETVPRLRFPEFRDAREWAPRELGPLTTKVGSGITPLGGDKNYKTNGRPFVRSQNVGWGELLVDDIAHIDEDTHRTFSATEIKEGDVLLNITGASIGRSTIADARVVGGNVNQHVCIIRLKADEMHPALLSQFLISDRGQEQIDSFQAGGNRQGLNFMQIRSFDIPTPPTEAEQRRIANCLSSLDALVSAQSRKLDILKLHKQGLMQGLFPSSEES
ncbi:MAG TPA: restriction endonuclease subunit S [Armatimonadota bacterium]|nr:restriction endonuclease subunit S [Armatimonadota bacterium]